jgi:hypothetical protein
VISTEKSGHGILLRRGLKNLQKTFYTNGKLKYRGISIRNDPIKDPATWLGEAKVPGWKHPMCSFNDGNSKVSTDLRPS